MGLSPDEIEVMKQIAANLEKCAAIMGQQIVIKDNKEVLQKDALNNIGRALILYLTVSDIPIKQYRDISQRLSWYKPEIAKRIEEQYYDIVCFAPIKWQKFDEAKQLTEIFRLQVKTNELAEDFRVFAEMAQRDIAPEGQKASGKAGETNKPKKKLKPLSEKAAAVLELLKTLPEHRGMIGPKILEALDKKNILIDQSTLTKNIIPELKPYGVKNRPRIGYYIEQ